MSHLQCNLQRVNNNVRIWSGSVNTMTGRTTVSRLRWEHKVCDNSPTQAVSASLWTVSTRASLASRMEPDLKPLPY